MINEFFIVTDLENRYFSTYNNCLIFTVKTIFYE